MEPDAARRLARFAYVLGRVARADLAITADEVRDDGALVAGGTAHGGAGGRRRADREEPAARSLGETDGYLVTREVAATADPRQKLALLDCCFAVAAADGDDPRLRKTPELRMITSEAELGLPRLHRGAAGIVMRCRGFEPRSATR